MVVSIVSSVGGIIVSVMYFRLKRIFKRELFKRDIQIQMLEIYLDSLSKTKKEIEKWQDIKNI